MDTQQIKETVVRNIKQLSEENDHPLEIIKDDDAIMDDIGLNSLQIATLISILETEIGIDPFVDSGIAITDVRTVEELCKAYEISLAKK